MLEKPTVFGLFTNLLCQNGPYCEVFIQTEFEEKFIIVGNNEYYSFVSTIRILRRTITFYRDFQFAWRCNADLSGIWYFG